MWNAATARKLAWALLALGLVLHAFGVADGWTKVRNADHGRDFASYHYAVHAAADGLDPYDKAALGKLAREEGTRRAVHPFFYPPPFLLGMSWVLPLTLPQAYSAWFWLDSLFLLAVVLALWKWRPGTGTLLGLAATLAALSAIPNNHVMGQANLPTLALMVWGAVLARNRPWLGGALVGVACMLKMSPALLVAWWLLRRRWKPVVSACGAALVLSLGSLGFGVEVTRTFYLDVLPGFSSGDYNGLTVPVDLFGNHSLPNLFAQIWPAADGLSSTARTAGSVSSVALLLGSVWLLRDNLAAVGALCIAMIITPVYAYEHHVTFALVSVVAVADALWERRLHWGWLALLLPAFVVMCWPIAQWKALADGRWLFQEAKFFALLAFGAACVVASRARA